MSVFRTWTERMLADDSIPDSSVCSSVSAVKHPQCLRQNDSIQEHKPQWSHPRVLRIYTSENPYERYHLQEDEDKKVICRLKGICIVGAERQLVQFTVFQVIWFQMKHVLFAIWESNERTRICPAGIRLTFRLPSPKCNPNTLGINPDECYLAPEIVQISYDFWSESAKSRFKLRYKPLGGMHWTENNTILILFQS